MSERPYLLQTPYRKLESGEREITTTLAQAARLDQLRVKRLEFDGALLSASSRRAYAYGWITFCRWAADLGVSSLPASTETLALFVTAQLTAGLKVSTVAQRVAAVRHMHLSAKHVSPKTAEIENLLCGARRIRCEQVRQVLPLTVQELRAIAVLLLADDTPIAIRNWALIMTGFTSALRNSGTAALMLADVEFVEKGAILHIRKEKNDQEGVGRLIGLPFGKHPETCVVTALKRWIERRGSYPGALFTHLDGHPAKERSLEPERIGQIVQAQIRRIGLNPKLYGGHSLRSGLVTETGTAGAGDLIIASQTGHRDMSTLKKYFRKRDVFVANPVSLLDL